MEMAQKKLKTSMKKYLWLMLLVIICFFKSIPAFAESSYVLPYPSFMPGSIFYKLNLVKEEVLKYWYFGNFGQFYYNLKQSDKYLVEAKTLFDYKQYLLAYKALRKSDRYFEKIGKNILEKKTRLKEAAQKHIEELTKLKSNVPSTFNWIPERNSPTILKLWESIDMSIRLREKKL